MLFWYLIILIVSIIGIRFCKNGFYHDYLDKGQCNAIKGIFILLVFLGHAIVEIRNCGYSVTRLTDRSAFSFFGEMGQLVVAMFFFYSGYGVMKSLINKGESYLDSYPRSRLLTTLVNFDIAVCFFILLDILLGKDLKLSQILFSFIGWDSVGNSNWYIFIILCCYLVFYIVFRVVRSHNLLRAFLVGFTLFIGVLILHEFKARHWFNTMLVFPAGVFFALYADKIERFIQKRYLVSLISLLGAFLVLHYLCDIRPLHGITHNLKSIVFSVLIVAMTMKIHIGNKWLYWCGFSLFPLYIYQRLPMNALKGLAGDVWICSHPHLFIGISFAITIGFAMLYNRFFRIKLR